ncbi:MAG: hypothetical protein V7750_11060 [Sneathiella sp.]
MRALALITILLSLTACQTSGLLSLLPPEHRIWPSTPKPVGPLDVDNMLSNVLKASTKEKGDAPTTGTVSTCRPYTLKFMSAQLNAPDLMALEKVLSMSRQYAWQEIVVWTAGGDKSVQLQQMRTSVQIARFIEKAAPIVRVRSGYEGEGDIYLDARCNKSKQLRKS